MPGFTEIYERIKLATNSRTQVELAEVLDIRQSSISDAKRRNSVPGDWFMKLFEKFGLNPVELPHAKDPNATHQQKMDDLIQAFSDPTIKAVITTIGGDHQIEYVHKLPAEPFRDNPKPFFGYSDNTHFSNFLKANPVTQLNNIPYNTLQSWVRSWFFTLHNEVNTENGKPLFQFADLTTTYANPNFQDLFWRLEPIIKKAIDLSGVPLFKWTAWVHSFKMMRSLLSV